MQASFSVGRSTTSPHRWKLRVITGSCCAVQRQDLTSLSIYEAAAWIPPLRRTAKRRKTMRVT